MIVQPFATPALPPFLDLLGIAVFAISGALAAVKMRQTFVTTCFFALVTGVAASAPGQSTRGSRWLIRAVAGAPLTLRRAGSPVPGRE